MKYRNLAIISLLFFALSTHLNAQNRITVTLEEFTAITVIGRADVELVPSKSHTMSITDKNGNPEQVEYVIKNSELKIKTKPDLKQENEIYIKVPYSTLASIEAANGAVVNSSDDLKSENLKLKAISGGKIELSVNTITIYAKVAQVSDIILYGKTNSQNVVANTGGNYLAYDLDCDEAVVKSTSGAQIKVNAKKKIEISATSKGFVGYYGDPNTTITKSSLGGEVANFKSKPGPTEN
jgi:hypothetical protein